MPLPKGARFVVDTQRLWHVVVHNGNAPRYALITSFESGPALETWIDTPARHRQRLIDSAAASPGALGTVDQRPGRSICPERIDIRLRRGRRARGSSSLLLVDQSEIVKCTDDPAAPVGGRARRAVPLAVRKASQATFCAVVVCP